MRQQNFGYLLLSSALWLVESALLSPSAARFGLQIKLDESLLKLFKFVAKYVGSYVSQIAFDVLTIESERLAN